MLPSYFKTNVKKVTKEIDQDCMICRGTEFERRFNHSPVIKDDSTNRDKGYHITRSERKKLKHLLDCKKCGFTFLPQEHMMDIKRYASAVDPLYKRQIDQRLRNATELLKRFKDLKSGMKLLEIGCSCGVLLKSARDNFGLKVCGVEPSTWAARYASEQFGLEIHKTYIEDAQFSEESFDVVILADVIEHLENPRRVLERVRDILKPGGQLLLLTPDIGSLTARLAGRFWWGILDEHNFYFSRKTLNLLLKECGFDVISCQSFGRIFSLKDWVFKLSQYHSFLYRSADWLVRLLGISNLPFHLNLGDQMVCLSIKNEKP